MSQAADTAFSRHGFWFSVARVVILAQAVVTVVGTILHLPTDYRNLLNLEPTRGFLGWSQEQLQAVVHGAGITPGALAPWLFAFSLICLLSFWGVAGLIAWRRSNTWFGLLIIYLLAGGAPGFAFLGSSIDLAPSSLFSMYRTVSIAIFWPTFFLLFYLFPDGRFVPRWTAYFAPIIYLSFPLEIWNNANPSLSGLITILQWLLILYAVGGIASQVYRYRSVSTPPERQQTKWVVFALGVMIASGFVTQAFLLVDPGFAIGTSKRFWLDVLANYILGTLLASLIPLSMGISILRYRLWDIDLIIRRTLPYALLSGLLGLVYFGSVVLLRQVLGRGAGESNITIVLSTLLVAALFEPVRRRMQTLIDRRFYRRKYDLAQALQEFSAAAQRDVEMNALTDQLVTVVEQTIQPETVSLWLAKGKR